MMKYILAISVILGLVILYSSGCATAYVKNIGSRRECLSRKRDGSGSIYVLEDGSMAIEVEASYVTDTMSSIVDSKRNGPRTVYQRRKYLVAGRAAVMNSLTNAFASTADAASLVQMIHFPRIATNEPNWQVIPSKFHAAASSPPIHFIDADVYEGCSIQLRLDDKEYAVVVGMWGHWMDAGVQRREKREWWGYPLQILVVPAAAFDVITFPYQFATAWKRAWDWN